MTERVKFSELSIEGEITWAPEPIASPVQNSTSEPTEADEWVTVYLGYRSRGRLEVVFSSEEMALLNNHFLGKDPISLVKIEPLLDRFTKHVINHPLEEN